jgi:hypothetical protein
VSVAVAAGSSVANLYYSQPLLARVGRTFGAVHSAGCVPGKRSVGRRLVVAVAKPLIAIGIYLAVMS